MERNFLSDLTKMVWAFMKRAAGQLWEQSNTASLVSMSAGALCVILRGVEGVKYVIMATSLSVFNRMVSLLLPTEEEFQRALFETFSMALHATAFLYAFLKWGMISEEAALWVASTIVFFTFAALVAIAIKRIIKRILNF